MLPPSSSPDIAGLLLAGGRSHRMGYDKAGIAYHGRAQLHHAFELLSQVASPCYVSIRADQQDDDLRRTRPCLTDAGDVAGPAAGLLAAHRCLPHASWLLLACDMPLMDRQLLQNLLDAAALDPQADVIAYAATDGGIEPLCALWRPSSCAALAMAGQAGQGLRHLAGSLRRRLLQPARPEHLCNANTPAESAAILSALQQQPDLGQRLDFME